MVRINEMMSRVLSIVCASACLAIAASGSTTYVVDVNGGAGVDFTDIPPAIAAASPGDVIVVHSGGYSGFNLDKGLSIVGAPGVTTSSIQIIGIGSGPRVAISSLHCVGLSVISCLVPVIVDDVAADLAGPMGPFASVDVETSADVRFRGLQVSGHFFGSNAVRTWQSRVEITSSSLSGQKGWDSPNGFDTAGPGGIGVLCDSGSDVHISLSTMQGGAGGNNQWNLDPPAYAGNGGAGIQVASTAKLLLTGIASNLVVGGNAGHSSDCQHNGYSGNGLSVASGGYARSSSVTIQAGSSLCGGYVSPPTSGSVDFVSPIDPSLELSGTTDPGQVLTLVVHGRPGDSARIRLGRQAVVHAQAGIYEDELTNPLRIYDLGALPASGQATKHVTIPGSLPQGYLMVFQASTVGSDGTTRLTQSAPVVVH
jgi:hypothetical protein